MITPSQCTAIFEVSRSKIFLGATRSAAHRSLLSSYLLNLWRGPAVVCDMIATDIGILVDLGALQRAVDMLIVLRQFLSDYSDAGPEQHPSKIADSDHVISNILGSILKTSS